MKKSDKFFIIGMLMIAVPFLGFVVWSYWINVMFTPDELEKWDMEGKKILVITPMIAANYCGEQTCPVSRNVETDDSQKAAIQRFLKLRSGMISDLDLINNTKVIDFHNTIILLDNTHVTKNVYDAIKNHPNVIYLYPNALERIVEIKDGKMTVVSGTHKEYPDCQGWDEDCRPTLETWKDKSIFDYITSKS